MNHRQIRHVLDRARGQYGLLSRHDARTLNVEWRALRALALDLGGTSWYRGTVQVPGPWDSHLSRCAAAAAAAGPGTLVSGRNAARCWGLTTANALPVRLLIPPTQSHPRLDRVAAWKPSTLTDEDRARVEGIPVASVRRTLLDLARQIALARGGPGPVSDELAEVIAKAVQRKLTSVSVLREYLASMPSVRGAGELAETLDLMDRDGRTDSGFERRVRAWLRTHGFTPAPGTYKLELPSGRLVWIDIAFPEERVGLEVDGLHWHGSPQQQHADIWREREIEEAGWVIWRVSERDIHDPQAALARYLAELLRRRREEACRTS